MHTYILWLRGGVGHAVPSVDAAQANVRERLPTAHFGRWSDVDGARNQPIWINSGAELRFAMGERGEDALPVCYIHVSDRRLATEFHCHRHVPEEVTARDSV